ncbi:ATP-binding protein [Deinococcus cellulosilyticus]|uniref:histidine kinase n=1 Tax=Deinococcus cellulosilyticus (strain DSM 18568 / NBRC 106333 / KACC 11606 / 5516J-15) TaxID=1223518 RepID=A0A511N0J3_DEIC1|nr:ATP-binding protein [Deinococcus cellulosilyticus]GEM46373.1 hypothetical protein DC3_20080 [Deinococcus cellulosilyticus NBRC 106333 = KACC 11606]
MAQHPSLLPDLSAHQVLQALREPAFVCRLDGSGLIPNQKLLAVFPLGQHPQQMLLDIVHEEDHVHFGTLLYHHTHQNLPFNLTFRAAHDASWHELTMDPIEHQGEVTGWLGRITVLESSSDHLTSILEHIPLAINVMGLDGEIKLMNRYQEMASRTTREAYLGRTVSEVTPHFSETFRRIFETILATGEALPSQEYFTPRGEWWRSFHFPIKSRDGRILAVGNASLNITEQKNAEQHAQEQTDFLQKVTEDIPVTIQIRNLKTGKVVFRNRYASAVIGYTHEEIEQMNMQQQFMLVPPEDLQKFLTIYDRIRALKDGESIEDEYRLKHKDGRWRWLFGRSTVFSRDEAGGPLESLSVGIDITDRKEAEILLKERDRQMQALLEGHKRFVSDASHEIKTPIAGIQGNLEVLLRYPDIPAEEKQEILQDCHREAVRLGRLVSDLLSLARADRGILLLETDVRLDVMLQDLLREFEPLKGNHDLLLGEVAPCTVQGDPERLKQLLVILTENALKYTPAGGEVSLTLAREGDRAILKVQDTGIGIRQEDLPRVFERYFRADSSRLGQDPGGTGLGLPIARWIVEAHGGEIWLESQVGLGTTVVVSLPGCLEM